MKLIMNILYLYLFFSMFLFSFIISSLQNLRVFDIDIDKDLQEIGNINLFFATAIISFGWILFMPVIAKEKQM